MTPQLHDTNNPQHHDNTTPTTLRYDGINTHTGEPPRDDAAIWAVRNWDLGPTGGPAAAAVITRSKLLFVIHPHGLKP